MLARSRVAIVGAGVMGSGIAQCLATAGFQVALHDLNDQRLAQAHEVILHGHYGFGRAVELQKLTQDQVDGALGRITLSTDLATAVSAVDLVLEAVPEDLELKVRVFRQLDQLCEAQTILASNTSGFPISALAGATSRPDRVIGWHWASPAVVMRAAEIVVHPGTGDAVLSAVVEAAKRAGKNPVVVKDDPTHWGFVANRIFRAAVAEAQAIVEQGIADPDAVDQIVKDGFRWPAGPFELTRRTRTNWE